VSTYTERLPQVKRVFRLYKDRVEVDASWTLGKDHHTTVRLEMLTPQVKRFFVRNRWFKRSIMVGSLAVAAAIVFTRGDYPDWVKRNALFGWVICGGCVIMAFLTYRKRAFARFNRKDGPPGLDICSAGPDAARFEEFVEQLQKRIRNA
jgi:hypothetical protein